MGGALQRQVAAILAVSRIDDEGDGGDGAAVAERRGHPGGLVDAGQHLAIPQEAELALDLLRRQPIGDALARPALLERKQDRKSTRLNSSHSQISYAVFCLKKKKKQKKQNIL